MQRDFPIGTIQSFSGAIVDIPSTWRLCDGTQGTPDLRDKFIVGAGNAYAVDQTGGAVQHEHDFTGVGHLHGITAGANIQGGGDFSAVTSTDQAVGTTDLDSTLSPYYALAFIMYKGVA